MGTQHPKVALCLDNYASLLRKLNRDEKAQGLRERAKAIRQELGLSNAQDVAITATLNPRFANFALSVHASRIHRWGVFAEERIPADHEVIEYAGERISLSEARRRASRSEVYFFTLDQDSQIDGGVGGSGAELINHCCEPNLDARTVEGHILFFSKRTIEPDEELTLDYNFSPKTRKYPCHCGSPKCRGTINLYDQ